MSLNYHKKTISEYKTQTNPQNHSNLNSSNLKSLLYSKEIKEKENIKPLFTSFPYKPTQIKEKNPISNLKKRLFFEGQSTGDKSYLSTNQNIFLNKSMIKHVNSNSAITSQMRHMGNSGNILNTSSNANNINRENKGITKESSKERLYLSQISQNYPNSHVKNNFLVEIDENSKSKSRQSGQWNLNQSQLSYNNTVMSNNTIGSNVNMNSNLNSNINTIDSSKKSILGLKDRMIRNIKLSNRNNTDSNSQFQNNNHNNHSRLISSHSINNTNQNSNTFLTSNETRPEKLNSNFKNLQDNHQSRNIQSSLSNQSLKDNMNSNHFHTTNILNPQTNIPNFNLNVSHIRIDVNTKEKDVLVKLESQLSSFMKTFSKKMSIQDGSNKKEILSNQIHQIENVGVLMKYFEDYAKYASSDYQSLLNKFNLCFGEVFQKLLEESSYLTKKIYEKEDVVEKIDKILYENGNLKRKLKEMEEENFKIKEYIKGIDSSIMNIQSRNVNSQSQSQGQIQKNNHTFSNSSNMNSTLINQNNSGYNNNEKIERNHKSHSIQYNQIQTSQMTENDIKDINKKLVNDLEAIYFQDKVNIRSNSINSNKIPKLDFYFNKEKKED